MSRGAVFLDRDGVLNRPVLREGLPYPPQTVDEVELLPGALQACSDVVNAGYRLIVVTNQPDVARKTQTPEELERINNWLHVRLPIHAWEICPHDDVDGCNCRKPKPGLLQRAAERFGIDLTRSFMVGDRWRDVDAGLAAGCRTIFLDYDYPEKRPRGPYRSATSLLEATKWILQDSTTGEAP
jgi:D-glycero-D-manno-heptose 1,7-bisphosphate phosphatase